MKTERLSLTPKISNLFSLFTLIVYKRLSNPMIDEEFIGDTYF